MKNHGKAATFAILALAVVCLALSLIAVAKLEAAKDAEESLRGGLKAKEQQLKDAGQKMAALADKVDQETAKRKNAESLKARAEMINATLTAQLEDGARRLREALQKTVVVRAELEDVQARLAEVGQGGVELRLAKAEIVRLEQELETARSGVIGDGPDDGGGERLVEGIVVSVHEPDLVTLSLNDNVAGGIPGILFVHRGGEIVGKIRIARVHSAMVAAPNPYVPSNFHATLASPALGVRRGV